MKKYLLVTVILVSPFFVLSAQQNAKFALVIGNGAYTAITPLRNPVNDASAMKTTLEGLGFQVELLTNATLRQMNEGVNRFSRRLEAATDSYGFFYYAGHGVQSAGENYLIPVNADIQREADFQYEALNMQRTLDYIQEAGNHLNVVVLDACRDNPFSWKRGGARGLTVVSAQPPGSIIVYATSAGSTAADGTGQNGLFTTHLLNNLKNQELELYDLFRRTMADVRQASGGAQVPAIYSQLDTAAYLGRRPAAPVIAAPAAQPVAGRPAAPPERPAPANMVRVEGGTFQMGSANGDDDEKPVHSVTVKSFYMAKCEVTQKEWQEIMGTNPGNFKGDDLPVENVSWYDAIEYCNKRSLKEGLTPAYRGSRDSTITCNFSATGYRLPTEAEWEYAAKGGDKDYLILSYSGSNNADAVGWYTDNSWRRTHPVGTKQANSLGLHDMSGNVWEWCWDWYGTYPRSALSDPAGAASGSGRVLRGGGWGSGAGNLRSADRDSGTPSNRYSSIGFRLVRP
ncbi:MAG: SUMF1/EgtB/PvdO family nonheme iron enzyme [Spirochaetales bacterium]|jgi:formylglycine-generating enzyme required for sulfatase activity|nr:SUMF1/EgtB/PvdO family nonheme iron enzyme [Spirochaetales bacterium]